MVAKFKKVATFKGVLAFLLNKSLVDWITRLEQFSNNSG